MLRDENDSLEYRSIADHYAALFLAFPVTSADIAKLKSAVQTPYQRTDNIDAFLKEQTNNLARLTENNHALNDAMAIELIRTAFTTNKVDALDFEPCFDKFILDNPNQADRTPARFCGALSIFVKNALPHFVSKRVINFTAKSAEETSVTNITEDEQAELLAFRAEKAAGKSNPPTHPPVYISECPTTRAIGSAEGRSQTKAWSSEVLLLVLRVRFSSRR